MQIEIRPAYDAIDTVRQLFGEYVAALGMDLAFQGFDEEFAGLPGKYAPPRGRLLLAFCDGKPAGCVAMRERDETACEMKRLFVRPEYRGLKIGLALVERVVAEAKEIGYAGIVLDTHTTMTKSVALYRGLGFYEIPPYYHNPYPDVVFLRLDLRDDQSERDRHAGK